jgi:hypothetical protein
MIHINTKVERREKGREKKAEVAAELDKKIKQELLNRLKKVNALIFVSNSQREFMMA